MKEDREFKDEARVRAQDEDEAFARYKVRVRRFNNFSFTIVIVGLAFISYVAGIFPIGDDYWTDDYRYGYFCTNCDWARVCGVPAVVVESGEVCRVCGQGRRYKVLARWHMRPAWFIDRVLDFELAIGEAKRLGFVKERSRWHRP